MNSAIADLSLELLLEKCNQLQASGLISEVLETYQAWLQGNDSAQKYIALFNYGTLLQRAQQWDAAEQAYRECIARQPQFAQAIINLGLILEKKGQSAQALQQWSSVIALGLQNDPVHKELQVMALNHIGRLQEVLKHYDLAEDALKQSLLINPKQPGVIQHWVHLRQKACKWPVYKPFPGISQNAMMMATSPLAMLAMVDDPVLQLLVAQSFGSRTYRMPEEFLSKDKNYRHKKPRIGYFSGDLCVHAVGLLLAELFEARDLERFETFAYDFSPEDGTPHRARLKATFDHWRDVRALDDRQAAQQILADEIDILIDLHGLSSGARPGVFALHPAPIQGTYLGFIGTTALPWLDFVIADRYALPEELALYFTERPLYVSDTFVPLSLGKPLPPTVRREEVGLPAQAFVMASFSNIYKVNAPLFESWMNMLKRIDNAVLWLLDDNPSATHNLRQEAARQGVAQTRLVFGARVGIGEYKARLQLADVYLDSYPYNCGSTARDVLEACVPMVTLSGKTFVSRMAGSLMKATGLEDLITTNFAEYENTVVNLANDRPLLAQYRQILQKNEKIKTDRPAKLMQSIEQQLALLLTEKNMTF